MKVKTISRKALLAEMANRLTDATGEIHMAPMIETRVGARPNWAVPLPRVSSLRDIVTQLQDEFDVRADICDACNDLDRAPAGVNRHGALFPIPMQESFGNPAMPATARSETRWQCATCRAQFRHQQGERWRLIGDEIDD